MLQAGRSPVRIPDKIDFFFNLPNPSTRTIALVSTQPLAEMSIRNLPEGKKRPAHRTDNRMSENVGASTSHNAKVLSVLYRDSFTLPSFYLNTRRFGDWIMAPERGSFSINWVEMSRFYPRTETKSSLRNVVCFQINTGRCFT
jgi:hypothetical protein